MKVSALSAAAADGLINMQCSKTMSVISVTSGFSVSHADKMHNHPIINFFIEKPPKQSNVNIF